MKAELKDMTRLGVTSYKLYMAYDNLMVNDREILEILEAENGIAGVHCENQKIIQGVTARLQKEEKKQIRFASQEPSGAILLFWSQPRESHC